MPPVSYPLRITPAYAGKSGHSCRGSGLSGDHPRVCGEENTIANAVGKCEGSPPRMRGRASHPTHNGDNLGITPAYAGKSACPV